MPPCVHFSDRSAFCVNSVAAPESSLLEYVFKCVEPLPACFVRFRLQPNIERSTHLHIATHKV